METQHRFIDCLYFKTHVICDLEPLFFIQTSQNSCEPTIISTHDFKRADEYFLEQLKILSIEFYILYTNIINSIKNKTYADFTLHEIEQITILFNSYLVNKNDMKIKLHTYGDNNMFSIRNSFHKQNNLQIILMGNYHPIISLYKFFKDHATKKFEIMYKDYIDYQSAGLDYDESDESDCEQDISTCMI